MTIHLEIKKDRGPSCKVLVDLSSGDSKTRINTYFSVYVNPRDESLLKSRLDFPSSPIGRAVRVATMITRVEWINQQRTQAKISGTLKSDEINKAPSFPFTGVYDAYLREGWLELEYND